jgi:hypothetical protein
LHIDDKAARRAKDADILIPQAKIREELRDFLAQLSQGCIEVSRRQLFRANFEGKVGWA